jgi:late competence protein required for DNA uptake (superfamily II DNA/RNA helicase)
MKAVFSSYNGLELEIEAPTLQELMQQISQIENAIGYEPCGKCKSGNVFPRHRNADGNDFYELACSDCGAVLQLGTNKEEKTLYKKKMETDSKGKAVKDENGKGKYLKDNGWLKWNASTKQME